ncbi:MAG: hypothetical protein LCH61_05800 [Proteobacteria bacterium]|nr:hypothetical protein [Pseudomonadota bacterium]
MTAPFQFTTDFSGLAPARKLIEMTPEDLEARLEERATEAYARGFADGGSLERNTRDAHLATSISTLMEQIADLEMTLRATTARQDATGARLAVALARKLAGRLRTADPIAALEEAFTGLVGDMRGETSVAIAVHPDLAAEAEQRLGACARTMLAGFTLAIIPDPDCAPGDARITWSDGGAILDQAAEEARIEAIIARILPVTGDLHD